MLAIALLLVCAFSDQETEITVVPGDNEVSAATVGAVRDLTIDAIDKFTPGFPGLRPGPFRVVVHDSPNSVPASVRSHLHEETAGVALLSEQEVHLILDAVRLHPPGDLRTVVRHEVVHILLHQFAGAAGPHVPRWFHEGLAQDLSGGTYLGVSEEDIVFHARTGNLLRFSKLRKGFPSGRSALRTAYAQSFSFVSFLRQKFGLTMLLDAVLDCGRDRAFPAAFQRQTGGPLVTVEYEWVEYVKTGSGAAWRILLASCFGLTMVAVLPLLVLAGARRWNRDHRSRSHLESEDRAEDPAEGVGPGQGP